MHTSRSLQRTLSLITLLAAALLVACSGGTDNEPGPSVEDTSSADGDVSTTDDTSTDTGVDDDTATAPDTSMPDAEDAADADTSTPDMGVTCTAPMAECDGDASTVCETDLDSSAQHCGQCSNACGSTEVCSSGECVTDCAGGTMNCDGSCVDTSSAAAHCGSCGNACAGAANAMAVCIGSACGAECVVGYDDCDEDRTSNGCEINTDTDPAHCGACDMACPGADHADPTCNVGVCGFACQADFGDCDGDETNGCETNLNASVEHCSACNNVCAGATNADGVCDAGSCDVVCQAGFDTCLDGSAADGCETDLMTDDTHCGACGNGCGAVTNGTTTCEEGACVVDSCTPTYHDLDLDPTNGCEFRLVGDPTRSGLPSGLTAGVAQLEFWPSASGDRLVALERHLVFGQPTTWDLWTFEPGGSNAVEMQDTISGQVSVGETTEILLANVDEYRVASSLGWWYQLANSLCDGTTCSSPIDAVPVRASTGVDAYLTVNSEGLKWSSHSFYSSTPPTKMPCAYNGDATSTCRVDEVALSEAQRLITFASGGIHYVLVTYGTPRQFALYSLDLVNGTLDSVSIAVGDELGVPDGAPVSDMVYLPASASVGHGFALSTDEVIQVYRFTSGSVTGWTLEAEFPNLSTGDTHNMYALDATRVVMKDASLSGFHSSPTKPGTGVAELSSSSLYTELAIDPDTSTVYAIRSGATQELDAFTWSP